MSRLEKVSIEERRFQKWYMNAPAALIIMEDFEKSHTRAVEYVWRFYKLNEKIVKIWLMHRPKRWYDYKKIVKATEIYLSWKEKRFSNDAEEPHKDVYWSFCALYIITHTENPTKAQRARAEDAIDYFIEHKEFKDLTKLAKLNRPETK